MNDDNIVKEIDKEYKLKQKLKNKKDKLVKIRTV